MTIIIIIIILKIIIIIIIIMKIIRIVIIIIMTITTTFGLNTLLVGYVLTSHTWMFVVECRPFFHQRVFKRGRWPFVYRIYFLQTETMIRIL